MGQGEGIYGVASVLPGGSSAGRTTGFISGIRLYLLSLYDIIKSIEPPRQYASYSFVAFLPAGMNARNFIPLGAILYVQEVLTHFIQKVTV